VEGVIAERSSLSLSRFPRLALVSRSLYLDVFMSRFLRRAFALASLALAGTTAWAQPAPVRLAAPQQGATLEAGSLAALAWDPLGPFDALAHVEEWEAFLSLDGGAHYPIRITPHLDSDLRRVLWQVPHIPTRDARLLLRFGNEHHETAVELPQRFAITGTVSPFEPGTVSLAATPGEPARPGDAGVVAWVEGSRRGGALRQKVAAGAVGLATGRSVAPDEAWQLALESEDSVPGPLHPLAGPKVRFTPPRPAAPRSFAVAAWPAQIPILLLTQRQNE
jgi:hypothetical protein